MHPTIILHNAGGDAATDAETKVSSVLAYSGTVILAVPQAADCPCLCAHGVAEVLHAIHFSIQAMIPIDCLSLGASSVMQIGIETNLSHIKIIITCTPGTEGMHFSLRRVSREARRSNGVVQGIGYICDLDPLILI
jgi:hypothetical protein